MNFTFVHITSASGEAVTPIEALTQAGAASDWVSYDADQCQPYAVGVLIQNDPNCSQEEWESYLFPLFRSEKREFNIKTANIAISGHCNVTIRPQCALWVVVLIRRRRPSPASSSVDAMNILLARD